FDEHRQELRRLLTSKESKDDQRAAVIQALLHDPDSRKEILSCLFDRSGRVQRVTQTLLAEDGDARRLVRERAADTRWLEPTLYALSSHPLQTMVATDPEAWPLLRRHLESGDGVLMSIVAPLLAEDEQAWPALRALLDDESSAVHAIRALGRDELARGELLKA